MSDIAAEKVRLDKWLWAARFYKTRNLAKQAVEGGKVYYNASRVKVSKEVEIGAELRLRIGLMEKTVIVKALSDQRRGAPDAQLLYEETLESIESRHRASELRQQMQQHLIAPAKPNKKERRQIHQFKEQHRE